MGVRDFPTFFLSLLGLLFAVLTLIAGSRKGTLNTTVIAGFNYDINPVVANDSDPVFLIAGIIPGNDLLWLFITVNYLSICGGYVLGGEDGEWFTLECHRKPAGFKFRTDDPWIMNFGRYNDTNPVLGIPLQTINTALPFATLIIGLVLAIIATGMITAEWVGKWKQYKKLAYVSSGLLWAASAFLTLSSALLHSIIKQHNGDYVGWTQQLDGFSWASAGFMLLAASWKLGNIFWLKEKRRRLLMTGQI